MSARLLKLVLLGTLACSTASAETIEDRPLKSDEILKEVALVGQRQFPKEALTLVKPSQNKWAINLSAFYDVAADDRNFLQSTHKTPEAIRMLPLSKVAKLYVKSTKANTVQIHNDCIANETYCLNREQNIVRLSSTASLSGKDIDSDLIHQIVAQGLVEPNDVIPVTDPHSKEQMSYGIPINSSFASAASQLYSAIDGAESKEKSQGAFSIGNAMMMASYNDALRKVSSIKFANIKVGFPLVYSAREKNLTIKPSVKRRFDVYWMVLAINPVKDLRGKMDEISFFVSLKTEDALTLDLASIRFGQEVTTKESYNTPEIKVETPQGGISTGKFYGREVSYRTLKPTIVGTGLQASEFGWTMSDEMIDMSAKRFIAIIGVPKGTHKLDLEMVLRARPSSPYGFIQQGVANSEPVGFSIELP